MLVSSTALNLDATLEQVKPPGPACPCPDHHGEGPTVYDLPIPLGLEGGVAAA